MNNIKSTIEGIKWPAVPEPLAAQLLACLNQLNHSQWLSPDEILPLQQNNIRELLQHAIDTVPFYQTIYAEQHVTSRSDWQQIPIIKRLDIQAAGTSMFSRALPQTHGKVSLVSTSGTSGIPLTLQSTSITQFMWMVFTLREHLWHQRDFSKKLVVIRSNSSNTHQKFELLKNWGAPVSLIYETGPAAYADIMQTPETLMQWLFEQKPGYFLTMPSMLHELLLVSQRSGMKPQNLLQVRTLGEVVTHELRELCQNIWHVPIIDMYSARELGYIALQCPETNYYHLQAEGLITEVLDNQGNICQPGEVGRLVVSNLYNFASPLIRYEIMDHVELAEACSCGRGLPAIRRILGRSRNLLRHPDGRRYHPSFSSQKWSGLAPIKQIQFVQKSLTDLEVRILPGRKFSVIEEDTLRTVFREVFDAPFDITFKYTNVPMRLINGKFEDFICEITDD